jgi:hypothetical protein
VAGVLVYRVFCMFRLLNSLVFVKRVMRVVYRMIPPFAINFVSLFLVFYVFAMLGMAMFARTIHKVRAPAGRLCLSPASCFTAAASFDACRAILV